MKASVTVQTIRGDCLQFLINRQIARDKNDEAVRKGLK